MGQFIRATIAKRRLRMLSGGWPGHRWCLGAPWPSSGALAPGLRDGSSRPLARGGECGCGEQKCAYLRHWVWGRGERRPQAPPRQHRGPRPKSPRSAQGAARCPGGKGNGLARPGSAVAWGSRGLVIAERTRTPCRQAPKSLRMAAASSFLPLFLPRLLVSASGLWGLPTAFGSRVPYRSAATCKTVRIAI